VGSPTKTKSHISNIHLTIIYRGKMRCPHCNKPVKENTDGDQFYCQGHDLVENYDVCEKCHQYRICYTVDDFNPIDGTHFARYVCLDCA
jgi:hypothetical protein